MNTELNVAINVPKALGKSVKTSINKSSSILEVIKNNVEKSIVDKIIHDNEFNRFALIYLNGERIKNADCLIRASQNDIDIIIPMAGG
ncbi:hypothetical protein [Photobacterium carnosum]|uniref:hypothetical protein n=1 Tax=Photobacterium carnosum TaxID=2023717 RepID=UPI001E4BF414|nr:hypothetical protein [Photobacterium carnosum]MCD9496908.1 hypothetical protein [Photobacterium carnosum]MCD9517013.1 hypothetical protein [Photobacterium carnosum]